MEFTREMLKNQQHLLKSFLQRCTGNPPLLHRAGYLGRNF
jgi:hypothetical protein